MRRPFTPQERVVIEGLWRGLLPKEVAVQIGRSEGAVRDCMARARRLVGARTTIDLMRKAMEQGALAP